MQHKAIRYSLDTEIKLSKIDEFTEYDTTKYTKLQDWVTEHKIGAMLSSDTDIHFRLLPIRPRVHIMYYLGDLSLLNKKILGIVGPRQMSSYGKQVVETLFDAMQGYDVVTISGMAEGVDQLAHTLSAQHHIPTIAVLGGGLGRYLKRNQRTIIDKIVADGGLVISEYKLGEKPSKYTFPQRNRLIAGLSDILFLPEAGEKSGSLITVDAALAMHTPVYATPGSIFAATSAGILKRIAQGDVKPIVDISGFLDTHFTKPTISSRPPTKLDLTDEEHHIIACLSRNQGLAMSEIAQKTGAKIQDIMQTITMLEIKGVVSQYDSGYILR